MLPPRRLSPDDFAALDLRGRTLRAREGRAQFRGAVKQSGVAGGLIFVDVERFERKDGPLWRAIPDNRYGGARDMTNIVLHADGKLTLDIMYIGTVTILPSRE